MFVGIPLRLGLNKVSKESLLSLKQVFFMRWFVGIAGGQDQRSLYFTGIVNDHLVKDPSLIFLDPHYVQEVSRDESKYSCHDPR